MKAIVSRRYGPPSRYRLEDVPVPSPSKEEVRIRIMAAALNPADWHIQRADPFPIRFSFGLLRPKHRVPGADFSGVIDAVGSQVANWRPGHEVFGELSLSGMGAFAEYAVAPAAQVARKPPDVSFEAAAALAMAGQTALQALRDHAHVAAGQRVLINGASGGVGTFAVQLATVMGARVTGVCSGRNLELVRSVGAAEVVDYQKEDVTTRRQAFDAVLDAAAYRHPADYAACLKPSGVYVLVGGSTANFLKLAMRGKSWGKRHGVRFTSFLQRTRSEDLDELARRCTQGKVRAVIDRSYELKDAAEALAYVESRRARGKVVLRVSPGPAPKLAKK